jgi:hypothetical protein
MAMDVQHRRALSVLALSPSVNVKALREMSSLMTTLRSLFCIVETKVILNTLWIHNIASAWAVVIKSLGLLLPTAAARSSVGAPAQDIFVAIC